MRLKDEVYINFAHGFAMLAPRTTDKVIMQSRLVFAVLQKRRRFSVSSEHLEKDKR